jgi:nucleoside-diphosphate-sugar epimerase
MDPVLTSKSSQYTNDIANSLDQNLSAEVLEEISVESARVSAEILKPGKISARTVLLIGGAGYIGPVISRDLLEAGYKVRCLDLLLYENDIAIASLLGNPNYDFVYGDHCDAAVVEKALVEVTDVVILSGLVGDPITKKYPEASGRINDSGMLDLIDLLNGRGLNRVVFVSTCSNYGLIKSDELADEDFELNPLSLYAKSKVAMEQSLLGRKGNVDYHPTALRFATAFGLGPRMRFDLSVSEFARDIFLGNELVVYDADTWRPYCHIRDFSRAIRRILELSVNRSSFEVFNAGGDINNFTKRMIVEEILDQVPDGKVSYQEHGVDPRNYRVNFAKIREQLLFEPAYTVQDGVAELIAAMKQNLFVKIDHRRNFHGNYEINYPLSRIAR